jgi:hypothetical protein
MTTVEQSGAVTIRERNVFARLLLVLTSPGEAYQEVAARPKALGAFAVVIGVMIVCQFVFLSTTVGQQVMVEQQISTTEAFGVTVTPQMEQQFQARAGYARYTTAASQVVFVPLAAALLAGLLLVIFNAASDRSATFKHLYAVVAHSGAVTAVQQIVTTPLSYVMGEFATVTRLSVFFPMLEEDSFLSHLFAGVELFLVWWLVNLSIGVAVLYRRPTRGTAYIILGIYGAIVLAIAVIRAVV